MQRPILLFTLLLAGGALNAQQTSVPPPGSPGGNIRAGIIFPGDAVPILSPDQAQSAEEKVANNPNDSATRLALLQYYATRSEQDDSELLKQARAKHILWLIQNNALPILPPIAALSPFTGSAFEKPYWIIYKAGRLGDPDNYENAKALFEQKLAAAGEPSPENLRLRQTAATFFALSDPEAADALFADPAAKGKLYADILLGITSRNLRTAFPETVDETRRTSQLGARVLSAVENSNESGLLLFFAGELNHDGSILYASGKSAWDYTPVLKAAVAKLQTISPDMDLSAIHLELPAPGRPWLPPVRLGGRVAEANLIYKVNPRYPEEAKRQLLQGTVEFTVMIGMDGTVQDVKYIRGPQELVDAARSAVEHWRYRPTLLNGNPVPVITEVNINFSFSPAR